MAMLANLQSTALVYVYRLSFTGVELLQALQEGQKFRGGEVVMDVVDSKSHVA